MRIQDSYPLSPVQHGMLIHSLSDPESGVYVQQLICALHEDLNVSAFHRAWQRIVRRHPIFRTSLSWEGPGEPLQQVHRDVGLPFNIHDWSGLPQDRQDELLQSFVRLDRRHGFHLNEAPLMRLALFRLSQADYRLIWTSHHVLLDGRSRLLVLKELFALYEAFCRGRNLHLKRPPPYRRYIDWLCRQDLADAENFWRRVLSGCTVSTPLVVDRVPTVQPEAEGFGKQSARFSERLTRALKRLARQHRLTPNTFLQGAWALLLSRYSGEEDVIFGATRAGRHSSVRGAESMVGLLINTVPVRVHVLSESLLLPWLRELRSQWIAMRNFEHTPLVNIQGWSQIPAGKPLFESLLVFENYQLTAALQEEGEGWEKREFQLLGTNNYPLTVVGYGGRELSLEMTYDRHRFDDATMTRMIGHYQTLLESMVADPERHISELALLTSAEQRQLLVEWNDTGSDYPRDKCIQELFEAQVRQTPGAVAVVFEDQQLTYQELNCRANQLAHYLRKLRVKPEVPVGICMERSAEMIVGLLGILKTGGAYVPLDPTYPKERLAFMLRETQAPVLLTQKRLVRELPEQGGRVVCLDEEWEVIAQESVANLDSGSTSDDLAYVIYTSGSTGKPKGVSVIHRGVVRLVKNQTYVTLNSEDVFLQFAPLSFDASTFEIWACLLNGAKLVVFPPYTPSLGELGEVVKRSQVTTLWLTSALFQLMVEDHIETFRGVKQLLAGGDVLSVPHVKKFLQEIPGCRLVNGYGPTENTTFTCCYRMTTPEQVGNSVSIGGPISNTRVYILDSRLAPVPIGVPGELLVGGDGLARSYFDNPELTAETFIPNPFGNDPGARLYKTGDLARWLPNGNIEFLGRLDYQVKIRGFRIEPGEVEAVLSQHPAVRQTVVMTREEAPGDPSAPLPSGLSLRVEDRAGKRLVAYVVPNQEQAFTVSGLRRFLKEKLPDYMVPSVFVTLEAFPLTLNGKVDRRALPAPDPTRPELDESFVAPRTPVEEVLAGIWGEVLGVKRIGIYDNFFGLGGHSLLATQVISRACNTFHAELPLRSLFESPTIAALAGRIEAVCRTEQGLQVPPLRPVSREESLPLSFAQQRLWFLDQWSPGSSVYNIPAAFHLTGPLNRVALEQSLNEIIRRHEMLRTSFSSIAGQLVQSIRPALRLTLPVADLSFLSEAEREFEALRLASEEARLPFDLAEAPLLRASVLRLAEEDHVLLFTIHHIVSDGWSMGVLFRELSALYDAFSIGKPSPLPELPIQYADFAVWQRQRLQGRALDSQLGYWKKQLADAPTALEFPTDRPRSAAQTLHGARQSVVLSQALTNRLKILSRQESVTLFVSLLAAFQTLLYRYTEHDDIVVGTPIAGRNRTEIEGLIGFFVNTLVLRTDLSGDPTFRELLRRVWKVVLEAYTHQDLPFEKLVEELHPERNFGRSPLFQVMFVLQNVPMATLRLTGLSVTAFEVDSETAKFDLTLSMVEEAGSLRGSVEYNTELFDGATIGRMMGHLQTLLEGIAANPDRRLSNLPILTEAEKQLLLIEWNRTKKDYPTRKCIHELFEAQAERTPDAIAVVFPSASSGHGEDTHLTYRELNARANRLAHYLSKLGVEPESLVGICVERSLEMVVGILGVLKTGGAYVSLDPAYPKERLAFMMEDSQTQVLLTQSRLLSQLPNMTADGRPLTDDVGRMTGDGRPTTDRRPHTERSTVIGPQSSVAQSAIRHPTVICLDTDWEVIAAKSQDNPVHAVTPDNLAYVIYTSGSTGKPKGVLVTHYNITRLLEATHSWFHFDQNDVWTLFHSYAFDFSVWEMWGSLLYGGRLVVVPYWVSRSPEMFYKLLSKEKVTVLNQTPSAFRHLIKVEQSSVDPQELALRLVIFGGEPLDFQCLRPWFNNHGDQYPQLVNMYGITETTVHVTYRPITEADLSPSVGSLIGVPIPDLELYILDQNQNPAPIGVPGELCVGGAGLGRGYLNRPELTAERFIPNPFGLGSGERLYRSGDLARYLANREIEYLGRIDAQVKIRGFRVEPGEIEAVLGQNPAVRETVVVARGDNPEGARLVAYVVPNLDSVPTAGELRNFLKSKLPDYMVPSFFVFRDAFPLTPNGKVDRSALPAPDQSRPDLKDAFVAPRTPVEKLTARIWAEVLKLDKVGVHDSFFDLGGHSLLAIQVISRVRETFHVEVFLRALFEKPTLAGFSETIAEATTRRAQHSRPSISPLPRRLQRLKLP